MSHRTLIAMVMAAGLVLVAGCVADGETGDPDQGFLGDVSADPGGFHPESWCAPQDAAALASLLLPNPWRLQGWGGQAAVLDPTTATLLDGDAADRAWFDRVCAERGIAQAGSGDLLIVVHPSKEWPSVIAACAPDLPVSDEAHFLRVRVTAAGFAEIHIFAPSEAGRRMAWQTVRQLALGMPLPAEELAIADAPAAALRGVIETFYGPSWDPADRIALMPKLAAMKFNTFLYASKMDVFTNWLFDYWKESWEPGYLAELAAIAAAAHDAGLLAGIQVRPLAAVMFSSEDDRALFVTRIGELLDLGFDLFSLSFDDTDRVLPLEDEAEFDSYDDAVTDFAADVLARLHADRPGLVFGFVPNDYWSGAPTASVSLKLTGERLPDYVTIGWTGRQIIPETITAEDADEVAAWMKRMPLLGDNYPVLDHAEVDLFLGPLEGRAGDLTAHVAGLMFNPMPYPFASLPALATCADYAWNSAAYDPQRSVQGMATFLAGPGPGADALALMADVNRSPTIGGSPALGLETAIASFWAAYDGAIGVGDAGSALVSAFLDPFARVGDDWSFVQDEALRAEIRPWATQLECCGAAGQVAVQLLHAKADGNPIDPDVLTAWDSSLATLRVSKQRPTAGVLQGFLDRAQRELVPVP